MSYAILLAVLFTNPLARGQVSATEPVRTLPDWRSADRLVAEFEPQSAIVIAWAFDEEEVQTTQLAMIRELCRTVDVAVLVPPAYTDKAREAIGQAVPKSLRVHLVETGFDTLWIRDYGPQILSNNGRPKLLDFSYSDTRPIDDEIPVVIGSRTGMPVDLVDIALDGGNLLTNGRGLAIATHAVFHDNRIRWNSVEEAEHELAKQLSVNKCVLLEPLLGEPTSHVDMFATFTDPRTIIVGQYDPQAEPENAKVLDRNAARLSRITTPLGRLRVIRIPMPAPVDDVWYSFTNVVYANGVVLVPRYQHISPQCDRRAVTVFKRALQGWEVRRIDSDPLIERAGALHCATLNLPKLRHAAWHRLTARAGVVHADVQWRAAEPVNRVRRVPTEWYSSWFPITVPAPSPIPEPVQK